MRESWRQGREPVDDASYESARQQLIENQRRQTEFSLHLFTPGLRRLRSSRWPEKANRSGVALSRYLLRRVELLDQINFWLERVAAGLFDPSFEAGFASQPDPDNWQQQAQQQQRWQFVTQVASQRRLINSCVEDWGLYVISDSSLLANYLDNYWQYQAGAKPDIFSPMPDPVDSIIGQRLEFDWALFEPTDYGQLAAELRQFHQQSPSEQARQRLLSRRQRGRRYRLSNRRLRQTDRLRFNRLTEYCRSGPAAARVNSDYLRDIIRFESLFLVDGDPVPDWRPSRLASHLKLVVDDGRDSNWSAA